MEDHLNRREVALARKMIIDSCTSDARRRKSLSISFQSPYKDQILRFAEILCDGKTRIVAIDYFGTIISDETRDSNIFVLPKQRLTNVRIKISSISEGHWSLDAPIYRDYYEDPKRFAVPAEEITKVPVTVFRLTYTQLLIGYLDIDTLLITRCSGRKTIYVTEPETAEPFGLHSIDDIVNFTMLEANSLYGTGKVPEKFYRDFSKKIEQLKQYLAGIRKDLLPLY